jgi:EAL and modified HD-GYP domain-containing signal transduction protein
VRDAVVVIGLAQLRSWIVLLALPGPGGDASALTGALVRARTCEGVAAGGTTCSPDAAFVVGLLDGLAEVLEITGEEVAGMLPALAPELAAALRGERTGLGDVLRAVRRYEQDGPSAGGASPHDAAVARAHLAALAWTGSAASLVAQTAQR